MSQCNSGWAKGSWGNVSIRLDHHPKQGSWKREIKYLINNKGLKGRMVYSQDAPNTKQYLGQYGHLVLWGVLYRWVTPLKKDQNVLQLVIPPDYQKKALKGCHDDIRHLAIEWMLDLLWDQFYWPRMTKDAKLHIAKCKWCIQFKSKPQRVRMKNIQATYLLQLVHQDYLTIETTEGGKDVHIIIIIEHFPRNAQVLVTAAQTAKVYSTGFMGPICSPLWSARMYYLWSRPPFWK